jgi:acylphosphatase
VVTEVTAVRLVAWVEGRVQGVGFRWWVRSRALELGLVGFAENLADGRVKVVAEGTSDRCRDLLELLADGTVSAKAIRGVDGTAGGDSVGGGNGTAGSGTGDNGRAGGGGAGGGGRGTARDLAAGRGAAAGGLVWPGRSHRPGRVTRVAHRWADAVGDMYGFTEK